MKKSRFTIVSMMIMLVISCKLKKQTVSDGRLKTQSYSQLSAENQKTANISLQLQDSSKITNRDSAFISIVEKDDIEYDYPNLIAGSPSKIIHHLEKTTNFQNGENIVNQKNIKSIATADLKNINKQSNEEKTSSEEAQHSILSITSSSTYWIWIIGLSILLCVITIYLIKKFNLINLIKSLVAKVI